MNGQILLSIVIHNITPTYSSVLLTQIEGAKRQTLDCSKAKAVIDPTALLDFSVSCGRVAGGGLGVRQPGLNTNST